MVRNFLDNVAYEYYYNIHLVMFYSDDIVKVPYSMFIHPLQAVAMRDTLARALYGALFDWIVDQVLPHDLS